MSTINDDIRSGKEWCRIDFFLGARTGHILRAYVIAAARWYLTRCAIRAVAKLDDRILKDMGIDRSEIERAVRCGRDC
jgi:uncharacterized protein YjiS (DUF1127 family)